MWLVYNGHVDISLFGKIYKVIKTLVPSCLSQLESALKTGGDRGDVGSEDTSTRSLVQQNIELRRKLEEEHAGYKRKLQAYQDGQQRQAQLVQKLQAKVGNTMATSHMISHMIHLKIYLQRTYSMVLKALKRRFKVGFYGLIRLNFMFLIYKRSCTGHHINDIKNVKLPQ